jgi:Spy/CpxP family protein refolding chaperone
MKAIALVTVLFVSGCAKAPLPGDSVAADGAVSLTPERVPSTPVGTAHTTAGDLSSIESRLFPPELVMEHQGAIGLAPAQRDAIAKETDRAHKALLELQWQLDAEKEKLVAVLDGDKVDEARSQAAAAEVMKREDAIKSGHLAMLVHIKNALTKEQQDKLRAIREAQRCAATSAPASAPR